MRAKRLVQSGLLLAALGLGGCEDPAIEQGTPPPVTLAQTMVVVPMHRFGAGRLLWSRIAALAPDGDEKTLNASIETLDPSLMKAARSRLIAFGLDPDRIVSLNRPDEVIVLTRTQAITTSCSAALHPGFFGDVDNSITSMGRCVQANNLAQMLVDPRDLAHPAHLGPTNGAVAARAVTQWEQGQVKQPQRTSLSSGNGGDDAGGDGGTAEAPAAAAPAASPQSAPPLSGNPLLSTAPLSGASAE
jgi:hypothetical protein